MASDPASAPSGPPQSPARFDVPRKASLVMPERLRSDTDDEHADVTAPKTRRGKLLNQSFLSLIANVGSNSNFAPHLAPALDPQLQLPERPRSTSPRRVRHADAHDTSERRLPTLDPMLQDDHDDEDLARSTPSLAPPPQRPTRLSPLRDDMSSSQILTRPAPDDISSGEPVFSGATSSDDQGTASNEEELEHVTGKIPQQQGTVTAENIARIFELHQQEEVIAEYQCALLQNIVLQGYLYITEKHVCFYAYLPKRSNVTTKSGWLYKRGLRNPNYHRYWFSLTGDVLSYYKNPKDLYFPWGTIDMPGALSAESTPSKTSAESLSFTVNTAHEKYQFRAESAASADQWVKQLQKVIFRCHNNGDSVKICLPLDNVLDVEESPFFHSGTSIRIKIIDNDQTFALDEYYFSFPDLGDDVTTILKEKSNGNKAMKDVASISASTTFVEDVKREDTPEKPRTTFGVVLGKDGRPVVDRRSTFEKQRATEVSATASDRDSDYEPRTPTDPATQTASQILQGSDLFKRPTIRPDRRASHFRPISQPQPVEDGEPYSQSGSSYLPARPQETPFRRSREAERPESSSGLAAAMKASPSTSSLTGFISAGASSLSKVPGLAGAVRNHSGKVGSLLAKQSQTYYEKVSGMWAGKQTHYDETEGSLPEDVGEAKEEDTDSFRRHFSLPETEKLRAAFFASSSSAVSVYGKLYVGDTKLCFRSLMPGIRRKMILPLKDIENVSPETGFNFGYSGLCLVVRGHEELFFDFRKPEIRDDCRVTLLKILDQTRDVADATFSAVEAQLEAQLAKAEYDSLSESYKNSPRAASALHERMTRSEDGDTQVVFDDMDASFVSFKPAKGQRIVCLTIGSRGDVQPYIALCKGLKKEGHHPVIATHQEFETFIRGHGIDFVAVAGDPAEIMRLCVEHDMFTVSFFREALSKFSGWVDELLESAWMACQGADLLIESPSAMAGIHIAEALQIPYFRAFTMPWTKTRAYPHAFTVPNEKKGGTYNALSYTIFDTLFWTPLAPQVNRWRRKRLGLKPTSLERMQQSKVPFLYNFSPNVVGPPLDFNHWIHITGYWFLDEAATYEPAKELSAFLSDARAAGKKIVYIGFGSITVEDPAALTRTVIEAVQKADVRCILSKGWSDKLQKDSESSEVPLPPEIHRITQAPHDWLFRQVDAAVHHGGAGTTGASLRAGIPTIVKPFFGDQFFFGSRVDDLGVGFCLKGLNTTLLARKIWLATRDARMITKAKILGQKIRNENGVDTAIQTIYRDLEYARDLVKQRSERQKREPASEESWTMIDDESDFDTARRSGTD